jgi:PAS domain S-box-containing protein
MLYVCRDVSERVKIELDYELLSLTLERRVEERTCELRESREQYRRLVEGLQDEYLFYCTNKEGTVTYVSPSIYTVLGYTPAEVIGHNWREFVDVNEPAIQEIERLERLRFEGLPTPPHLTPVQHAQGEIRVLEFRDVPLKDADGCVIANEGIGRDITQRHRAEEALRQAHEQLERRVQERTAELTAANEQLRESEQRYRSVVEDHLEFIIRWRGDGVLTFSNNSYCKYWGAGYHDLLGTSFMTTIVQQDLETLTQRLATVSKDNPVVEHQHRVVLPDGRTAWQRWSHRALFNRDGEATEFQSVGCDCTEQRKREERLRERDVAVARLQALSDRERAVMSLVVDGDANKVIARKLGLSVKTIEKHRSSMMRKLQLRSVAELVRMAMMVEASAGDL